MWTWAETCEIVGAWSNQYTETELKAAFAYMFGEHFLRLIFAWQPFNPRKIIECVGKGFTRLIARQAVWSLWAELQWRRGNVSMSNPRG